MQLRNRRTGERFDGNGRRLDQGFFRQKNNTPIHDNVQEKIDFFIADIRKRLPSKLSFKEKEKIITMLKFEAQRNKSQIQALLSDPEKMQALFEKKEKNPSKHSLKMSNLFDLFKKISEMALTAQFPLEALTLAMLPTLAAAAGTSYVVHEGMPTGGMDYCSGVIFGCLQGYVTEGDHPWTLDLPQFKRIVSNISGSLDPWASESLQLKNCMSVKKVGGLVVKALEAGQGASKTAVPLSGEAIWHQLQVRGLASNIPENVTDSLESDFIIESQACMNDWEKLKYQGIIAGSILGGICLIACCVGACWFAYNKYHEEESCLPGASPTVRL